MDINPLSSKIQAHLPISLEGFMELVLYDPDWGYYANHSVIGKQQDFITAPELTPLFGYCIAQWCTDQWVNAGKPSPINLIELGAGRGTMLKDILSALSSAPEFFSVLTPFILERSETLITLQKDTLQTYPNVTWVESLDSIKTGYSIILANEFFDALPIQYYRNHSGNLQEAIITSLQELSLSWRKTEKHLADARQDIFMTSTFYETFTQQISKLLHRLRGIGLIIDYGSESPGFSLQAIRHHKKVGIFDSLGLSDLTHQVDFTYLKTLFLNQGVNVLGPQKQADFLKEVGIAELLENLRARMSRDKYLQHALAVHRLVSSGEMGDLFKVMAIQGGPNGC